MSNPLTGAEHRMRYAALCNDYRARRTALDVDYDHALDQHGSDPVLLVACMNNFDALDAEYWAKRDALDADAATAQNADKPPAKGSERERERQ